MRTKEKQREYNRRNYLKHRAARLAYAAAYRVAHRDELITYQREYRRTHGDHVRELERIRRSKNPERKRAMNRKWRKSARGKAWRAAWNAANRDKLRAANLRGEANRKAKMQANPEYYAKRRAQIRVCHAKFAIKTRGIYRPRFAARYPDWVLMGKGVDARSQFLDVNITDSQRAYARELAIERRRRSRT